VMTIFCDAAWNDQVGAERKPAGHGVTINIQGNNQHLKQIHVATLASSIFSSLSRDPHYYTDSLVLSSATRASSVFAAPGHWENRPLLAEIQASRSFQSSRITHIRITQSRSSCLVSSSSSKQTLSGPLFRFSRRFVSSQGHSLCF
jgi:hypothetical protein